MIKENQIFISIKQFAEMTGVSQVHAYRLVKSGEVPSTMFGTRHCIPRTFLEEKAKAKNRSYNDVEAEALSYSSIKEYVSPVDIANQILFLANDTGRMVTGQAISVCGDLKMLSK